MAVICAIINVESFRSLLGIVEQDVFLFDGTIAQNIAYARREATASEVRAAAEAANACEFIDRMSSGMQTIIGERGVRLSGGQRQRLAIARAILAEIQNCSFSTKPRATLTPKANN